MNAKAVHAERIANTKQYFAESLQDFFRLNLLTKKPPKTIPAERKINKSKTFCHTKEIASLIIKQTQRWCRKKRQKFACLMIKKPQHICRLCTNTFYWSTEVHFAIVLIQSMSKELKPIGVLQQTITWRPESVKLDLPLFWCPSAGIIMSLPSSMADFVPCDRLLQKTYS